jgi:hypothetical protein
MVPSAFPAGDAQDAVGRPAFHRPSIRRHWALDDIPWGAIRHEAMAGSEAFFYLIASASLMESATDLYTANLIDYFAGDDEVTSWLEQCWLPEELQHGRGLRRYVEAAWPDFSWEAWPRDGVALRGRNRDRQLL